MRNLKLSLKAMALFTLLTGVLYPLSVTFLGRVAFQKQAGGSLVRRNGVVVGSELIAQAFAESRYFWPRPSAVKYDASGSGASNLSVTAANLLTAVAEREKQGAVAEMRYSSGSGLDPHISPEAAMAQVKRVALARNISPKQVFQMLESQIRERQFGILGQKTVNVLLLNLALDKE